MEAAAMWESAQQVSGWFPCSQGLEDMEAKAPPKPQRHEAEAPRKVIGDMGQVAQGVTRKRGLVLMSRPKYPLRITSSLYLPRLPLPTWRVWRSMTPRCSEQAKVWSETPLKRVCV